jgi:hypothetical protein
MSERSCRLFFVVLSAYLSVGVTGRVTGQEWADKMFDTLKHDFGTVARNTKTEYRFQIKNLYKEDMRISSVGVSCGCTTPILSKRLLKTGETAELVARYNTDRFTGKRGATITVRFAPPFRAEVRLRVDGYIRTDVVFDPNRIELGTVNEGEIAEKVVKIRYSGRSNWQIVEVKSSNEHVHAEAVATNRRGGRIEYELRLKLASGAPAGYINDAITIVTNDRSRTTLRLPVEGRVVPAVSVSPDTLQLGVLRPGQSVTKQIVVRARAPFQISKVRCESGDKCFQFKAGDAERKLHLIPVTFVASERTGKFTERILINAKGIAGGLPAVVVHVEVVAE